jgi:hypothetical protein
MNTAKDRPIREKESTDRSKLSDFVLFVLPSVRPPLEIHLKVGH